MNKMWNILDTAPSNSSSGFQLGKAAAQSVMNEVITKTIELTNTTPQERMDENMMKMGNNTFHDSVEDPYIFDRTDIKAIFLTLYTIVFCSCFFGNLMVILVVTLHWRMRSITNFCLANLAVADMCVGIFCVYQNIISYMMESWPFGEFFCKMYHFVSSLSTTASILILVVICIERYLAIIHPMRCKQMMTLSRLRLTIIGVWISSAIISSPRFYYFGTTTNTYPDGREEVMCIPNRTKYNSKMVDMISMSLLFLLPLLVITILYFCIGVALWKSSNTNMPSASASAESSSSSGRCDSNTGNANEPNSPKPSPALFGRDRKKGTLHTMTCLKLNCSQCTHRGPRKRKRRSSGSFYGADKLGYPTAVNSSTGNFSSIRGPTRNVNGLTISYNGNSSLQPIRPIPTCQGQTACSSVTQHESKIQCCTCASTIASKSGAQSVPVSPYQKRDSTPISSPTTSSIVTEPIILVKFEKKSSLKKCKRNQCTIMLRSAVSASTLNDESHPANEGKGEYNNCYNNEHFPREHGSNSITQRGDSSEGASCSCNEMGAKNMLLSCPLCKKLEISGTQHDLSLKPRSHEAGCDKNSDFNQLNCPIHNNGHFGASGNVPTGINFKPSHSSTHPPTIPTIKGPKRMRVIRSSKYGTRALQCRRRIIKMLIIIVFAFALCHLPYHARKIWQYWGKGYEVGSVFSTLFTPITFLIMYVQSGINPILYAFMSRKFRSSFADLLCCNMRRSLKMSRNLSVRSTNVISQAA